MTFFSASNRKACSYVTKYLWKPCTLTWCFHSHREERALDIFSKSDSRDPLCVRLLSCDTSKRWARWGISRSISVKALTWLRSNGKRFECTRKIWNAKWSGVIKQLPDVYLISKQFGTQNKSSLIYELYTLPREPEI